VIYRLIYSLRIGLRLVSISFRARSFVYLLSIGCGLPGHLFADSLLRNLQKPRVKALLDTIAYAEGTLKYGNDSYRVLFGGRLFGDGTNRSFDQHPRTRSCLSRRGRELCTTAAGRYQIQWPTWDYFMRIRNINKKCGDGRFTPLNQDRVALQAVIDCDGLNKLFNEPIPFTDLFACLGRTWSSMPGSKWNYVVYTVGELQNVFDTQLKKYV
jgi:muramidase (phage lysozyme)